MLCSFVIKTKDEMSHRKTFINVCGCAEIPVPGDWSNGQVPKEVTAALKSTSNGDSRNEALRFGCVTFDGDASVKCRFPLSLSEAKTDVDRQGETCTVYDILFNSNLTISASLHRRLKVFLIGLAIEWVSQKVRNHVHAVCNEKRVE